MSPRAAPLHREPLVVALVLLNLSLGGLLLYKEYGPPRALPPGHPDVSAGPSGAAMTGGGEMAPDLAAIEAAARGETPAAGFALSGTVKAAAKVTASWPAGSPVFVIARGEAGGPPFAVRRYDGVKAPFKYSLGPGNVMLAGAAVPKRLVVTVRVDQDGDAMTRQLGDLEGGPSAPVGPRGSVDVTVDRPARLAP